MSGPALRTRSSHRAIHDAVIEEIREAVSVLSSINKEKVHAIQEARLALIDVWQEKVIAHATEEENGLYLEILSNKPEMKDTLTRLSRDHQLLSLLLEQAKTRISEPTGAEFMAINEAMILLMEIHSRDEESILPL